MHSKTVTLIKPIGRVENRQRTRAAHVVSSNSHDAVPESALGYLDSSPLLAVLQAKASFTAKEVKEQAALEALNRLSAGFKCEAYTLERNKKNGKWDKKTAIPSATKVIDNVIEEGGKTYGYHG